MRLNQTRPRATVTARLMNRTPEDIQDELLVLQYQSGDHEALRPLVARWQPRMAGLAWRLTCEREAARDIVQDSWLAVVRGLGRLDDPARFRAWVYRTVRNKCTDWMRRRTVQRRAFENLCDDASPSPSERPTQSGSAVTIDGLGNALSKLAAEQKAILALYYLEGLSITEIAAVFEVPAGTVKSKLFYARNRLKEAIERTEP